MISSIVSENQERLCTRGQSWRSVLDMTFGSSGSAALKSHDSLLDGRRDTSRSHCLCKEAAIYECDQRSWMLKIHRRCRASCAPINISTSLSGKTLHTSARLCSTYCIMTSQENSPHAELASCSPDLSPTGNIWGNIALLKNSSNWSPDFQDVYRQIIKKWGWYTMVNDTLYQRLLDAKKYTYLCVVRYILRIGFGLLVDHFGQQTF